MQTVVFKAGETIIREGEEGNTAFYIVNGAVDVILGQGAKARTACTLDSGEVFGEMCLIEPGLRSATIRAATDAECLSTSYEEFIAEIEHNPVRTVEFMKTLVRRLRQMNNMMESLGPQKRGFRDMIRDWQKSAGPDDPGRKEASLSFDMIW
jgi:CRP/FNR family transcriptional regulator, cyclic AMP receptor protein